MNTAVSKLSEHKKSFHTCSELLPLKKTLEKSIKSCDWKTHENVRTHFQTPFKYRKFEFYKKCLNLCCDCHKCKDILEIVDKIIDIYCTKMSKLESLEYEVEEFISQMEKREEQIAYMREYHWYS